MSRYRPIAPKPGPPERAMPESLLGHSYWPTRTRKRCRGRGGPFSLFRLPPPKFKKPRHPPPFSQGSTFNHRHLPRIGLTAVNGGSETPPSEVPNPTAGADKKAIPEEKDLLMQLAGPVKSYHTSAYAGVIAPTPVRPVGSSIVLRCINEYRSPGQAIFRGRTAWPARADAEEVEKEVEAEGIPAVISDSGNRVRLANSAYKEMVGQPECSWLRSMTGGGKRISGEVALRPSGLKVPMTVNGFSCWARIDWGSNGKEESVEAFCEAVRVTCDSKDYAFAWKFHTLPNVA